MTTRLAVFDLDGTLVDSLRDLADAANALLVECGASPLDRGAIGGMVGDGAAVLVSRAFAAAGVPQPPEALSRFLDLYHSRLLEFTRPYPGVEEALTGLFPRMRLAVLTNKPIGPTREILDGLNLARFFDREAVLGGDGPLPRKPDPSGLQKLMRDAATAAHETVLVGDSNVDLQTARAGGITAYLARYGFGFSSIPTADLRPADRPIEQPLDLLRFL